MAALYMWCGLFVELFLLSSFLHTKSKNSYLATQLVALFTFCCSILVFIKWNAKYSKTTSNRTRKRRRRRQSNITALLCILNKLVSSSDFQVTGQCWQWQRVYQGETAAEKPSRLDSQQKSVKMTLRTHMAYGELQILT